MTLLVEASPATVPAPPGAGSTGAQPADGLFAGLVAALLGDAVAAESGQPPSIAPGVEGVGEEGEDAADPSSPLVVVAPFAAQAPSPGSAATEATHGLIPVAPTSQTAASQPLGEIASNEDTAPPPSLARDAAPSLDPTVEEATPADAPVDTGQDPGEHQPAMPPDEPPPVSSPLTAADSVVRLVGNADDTTETQGKTPSPTTQPLAAAALPSSSSASMAAPVAGADGPAGPSPAPVPTPVAQVAQAVFDRVLEGGGEARLRLDPPDLGEILIHVKVDGGQVHVDVHADSPEAAQLLKDSTPNLSTLLGERGLGLADVSVGAGERDPRQQPGAQDASANGGHRDDGAFAALMGIDTGGDVRQHNRIRAAYNPDGVFIYRI